MNKSEVFQDCLQKFNCSLKRRVPQDAKNGHKAKNACEPIKNLSDDLKPGFEEKAIKFLIEDTKKNDKVKGWILTIAPYRVLWYDRRYNVNNLLITLLCKQPCRS